MRFLSKYYNKNLLSIHLNNLFLLLVISLETTTPHVSKYDCLQVLVLIAQNIDLTKHPNLPISRLQHQVSISSLIGQRLYVLFLQKKYWFFKRDTIIQSRRDKLSKHKTNKNCIYFVLLYFFLCIFSFKLFRKMKNNIKNTSIMNLCTCRWLQFTTLLHKKTR